MQAVYAKACLCTDGRRILKIYTNYAKQTMNMQTCAHLNGAIIKMYVRSYVKGISGKRTDGVKGGAVSVKDKRDARGVKADSALSPRSGTMTRSIHISITTLTLSNLQPSLHC